MAPLDYKPTSILILSIFMHRNNIHKDKTEEKQ